MRFITVNIHVLPRTIHRRHRQSDMVVRRLGRTVEREIPWGSWPGRTGLWEDWDCPCCGINGAGADSSGSWNEILGHGHGGGSPHFHDWTGHLKQLSKSEKSELRSNLHTLDVNFITWEISLYIYSVKLQFNSCETWVWIHTCCLIYPSGIQLL